MKYTPGPWSVECVSDAIRVFVRLTRHSGQGTVKVILARLAPPRLPEAETHANARLMAAAPELLEALKFALQSLGDPVDTNMRLAAVIQGNHAIARAEGEQKQHGGKAGGLDK